MKGSFSTFLRQNIRLMVVLTFVANVIMLAAFLSYTESRQNELADIDNTIKKKSQDNNGKEVKKETVNATYKSSKQNKWEVFSNDKGQMDYMPVRRLVGSRNNKKYSLGNYAPVGNSEQADKEDLKVPNTFNERYIKYFWKHPEFYTRNSSRETKREITKFHEKTNKVLNKKPERIIHRKNEKHKDLREIPGTKMLADDKQKQESINIKKTNKHSNKSKDFHKPLKLSEDKTEVRKSEDLQEHLKLSKPSDKEAKNVTNNNGKNQEKDVSYVTMFPAKGQLGNQMFQLASLLGIADRGNFIPFLSKSVFDLNKVFRLPEELSKSLDISYFETFTESSYTQYTSIKLSQKLSNHKNWTLNGYFQSFKYFSHVSHKVRDHLTFHGHISRAAKEFIQKMSPVENIKVAIHIRRQDFISSYEISLGRVAATPDYVRRAMRYFQSRYNNVTFIVVSDEMKWCKQYVTGDNVVYSTVPYNEKEVDLAIISSCDHVIISVGTFGWWGGWLASGTVVYYNKFPRPGSELDKTFVAENYYPSSWIPME